MHQAPMYWPDNNKIANKNWILLPVECLRVSFSLASSTRCSVSSSECTLYVICAFLAAALYFYWPTKYLTFITLLLLTTTTACDLLLYNALYSYRYMLCEWYKIRCYRSTQRAHIFFIFHAIKVIPEIDRKFNNNSTEKTLECQYHQYQL